MLGFASRVVLARPLRNVRRADRGAEGELAAAARHGGLRPGVVIPTHYEMFASNLGDAPAFADYVRVKYPAQAVHLCSHGEPFVVRAAR